MQDDECGSSTEGQEANVDIQSTQTWERFVRGILKRRHGQTFAAIQRDNHEKFLKGQQEMGMSWKKRVFGIGPDNKIMPASRMIYPLSPFGIAWLVSSALFLGYTAVFTPPVVAFHWLDHQCVKVPTLPADVFVDIFFLLDMVVTFNTGRLAHGEYDDEFKTVALSYLSGMFVFDFVTSFPVSFIELYAQAMCASAEPNIKVDSGQLRILRALKPLRFMKVARIMKLGKLGFIFDMLSDFFNISPKAGKTFKVMSGLLMLIHTFACFWWLWKVVAGGEGEVERFLDSVSWGDGAPSSIHSEAGKFEAYIISCYLITMTLTTVGYGDIGADNTSERVGYIILFIVGAFVWGTLLAEVGDIHSASSARGKEKMDRVQTVLEFLLDCDCPSVLRTRIVQFTRFYEEHSDANVKKKLFIEELPPDLRAELVQHLYTPLTSNIPLFKFIKSSLRNDEKSVFMSDISTCFDYKTYMPNEVIVQMHQGADRLIIIVEGIVEIAFEHPTLHLPKCRDFVKGDYLGDFSILGDTDWGNSTAFSLLVNTTREPVDIEARAAPSSFVVVLELELKKFQEALSKSSFTIQKVVGMFVSKWLRSNQDGLDGYSPYITLRWDTISRGLMKQQRNASEDKWKFTSSYQTTASQAQHLGHLRQAKQQPSLTDSSTQQASPRTEKMREDSDDEEVLLSQRLGHAYGDYNTRHFSHLHKGQTDVDQGTIGAEATAFQRNGPRLPVATPEQKDVDVDDKTTKPEIAFSQRDAYRPNLTLSNHRPHLTLGNYLHEDQNDVQQSRIEPETSFSQRDGPRLLPVANPTQGFQRNGQPPVSRVTFTVTRDVPQGNRQPRLEDAMEIDDLDLDLMVTGTNFGSGQSFGASKSGEDGDMRCAKSCGRLAWDTEEHSSEYHHVSARIRNLECCVKETNTKLDTTNKWLQGIERKLALLVPEESDAFAAVAKHSRGVSQVSLKL